ncbi:hypothetical protein [Paraburkholderia tuberum]|uniref:hypothetical protein n=1 Tax=Paraburkholderia tuberum TaxID=157910 RepID=UPI0019550DE4|nr:hypothetical protein [Paraburkholderia tuberum]
MQHNERRMSGGSVANETEAPDLLQRKPEGCTRQPVCRIPPPDRQLQFAIMPHARANGRTAQLSRLRLIFKFTIKDFCWRNYGATIVRSQTTNRFDTVWANIRRVSHVRQPRFRNNSAYRKEPTIRLGWQRPYPRLVGDVNC